MNENLPWVEKYRPSCFDDIISQKYIIESLNKLIDNNCLSHVLFYGLPGTGKTTTIFACAKKIYGSSHNSMILELNGSDDRGIDIVRDKIKSFANYSLTDDNYTKKLVILDEADAMTFDAQFALRKVIDNYINTTRFCLICNYITKIIPALQSRCQLFRFLPINQNDHIMKIISIVHNEKINIDNDAIKLIVDISDGDMRKSINLLQTIFMTTNNTAINKKTIYTLIGYPFNEKNILTTLVYSTSNIHSIFTEIIKSQINPYDIIKELMNIVINNHSINKLKKIEFIITLSNIELCLVANSNFNIHVYAICAAIYNLNH